MQAQSKAVFVAALMIVVGFGFVVFAALIGVEMESKLMQDNAAPAVAPAAPTPAPVTNESRFALSKVDVLNLARTDADLGGFDSGFAHGAFGYVLPYRNGNGTYAKVARFRLDDFNTVQVLDLAKADAELKGFHGGFTDGTWGYVVPFYDSGAESKLARFRLNDFATVQVLDLSKLDAGLAGFTGGFTDGTHGYVVPNNAASNYKRLNGKVARVRLDDFKTVQVLDLTQSSDPDLKGFYGGFTDGTHGYLVPQYNGINYHGKVTRFRLDDFATVEVLDLTKHGVDLKGFRGGFSDGTFGYVMPYYGGAKGKVTRFRLDDFATVQVLDLAKFDAGLAGFIGGFTDGTFGYAIPYNRVSHSKVARFRLDDFNAVQVLDLARTDADLRGFIGGFTDGMHGYAVPFHGGANGKVARFEVVAHLPRAGWQSSP